MALEHERITVHDCVCHQDQATGLYTEICVAHETQRAIHNKKLRSDPFNFLDLDYFWTGYSNQDEVDRLRRAIRAQAPGSVRVLMGKLREAVSLAAKSYYRDRPHVGSKEVRP